MSEEKKFQQIFESLTPKEQRLIVDLVVLVASKNTEIDGLARFVLGKQPKINESTKS